METEITVKVLMTKQNLINLLNDNNFEFDSSFDMKDVYFSSLGGVEEVKNYDYETLITRSMLVREVTENEESDKKLIYKNKKFDTQGNVIGENKIACHLEDCSKCILILKTAGFKPWCEVKNHSEIFKCGEIELVIQEIEDLGLFIEFEEYPSIANKTNEEKFESLVNKLKELGIKTTEEYSIKKPYMILHKDEL